MSKTHNLLKIAKQRPDLREVVIYKLSKEHASPEALKQYLKDHPNADPSKHTVKGEGDDHGDGHDDHHNKGFFDNIKGLAKSVKDTVAALPAKTKEFITDSDKRKEMTDSMVEGIKKSPGKLWSNVKKHVAHEVEEVGGLIKNIASGKKPTKSQMKAAAGLAIEIGIAAFAASTAGAGGAAAVGAKKLAKGIVKHTILSAMSGGLGDAYVFGYGTGTLLADAFSLVAAEEGEQDPEKEMEKFAVELEKFMAEVLSKGISDEVMEKALKEMGDEKEEKKSARLLENKMASLFDRQTSSSRVASAWLLTK